MADRVFIIPLRNDLAGVGLNLGDLHPNAGQKNSVYEGTPQNNYVAESLDVPGATVQNGLAYVSGSLNTLVAGAAGYNDVDDRTSVAAGANDVSATQLTAFGLSAYFFDRVDPGGAAGAGTNPMTVAQADACAAAVTAAALAGNALTLAAINTLLSVACGAVATDLDGAAATSDSFGTVREVLRILAGEVYRLPAFTILGDVSTGTSDFLGLAARQVIVDAQLGSDVTTYGQFYASGDFLAADDAGYRARPTLVPTGAFNISNAEGMINGYKGNVTVLNRNFAYSAAAVTTWRPRAFQLGGLAAIPATGIAPAIGVYNQDGTAL
jgi:hypothetical protein